MRVFAVLERQAFGFGLEGRGGMKGGGGEVHSFIVEGAVSCYTKDVWVGSKQMARAQVVLGVRALKVATVVDPFSTAVCKATGAEAKKKRKEGRKRRART